MTIFLFQGFGGGAGFTQQMSFTAINQVAATEFALPAGHIPTILARGATNQFDTVIGRRCTLVALSIAVQVASGQGAATLNTRLNGGAAVPQLVLANATLEASGLLTTPLAQFALGDNLEITLSAPTNCALASAQVTAFFV